MTKVKFFLFKILFPGIYQKFKWMEEELSGFYLHC